MARVSLSSRGALRPAPTVVATTLRVGAMLLTAGGVASMGTDPEARVAEAASGARTALEEVLLAVGVLLKLLMLESISTCIASRGIFLPYNTGQDVSNGPESRTTIRAEANC